MGNTLSKHQKQEIVRQISEGADQAQRRLAYLDVTIHKPMCATVKNRESNYKEVISVE